MSDSEDQFEYEDDDYVDEDDDDDYRIDSEDEEHIEFEEARRDESVKVFEEDQLLVQQHEVMKRVSELLNITPSAACCLLRHFKWNYDELSQKYFEDPDGLRGSLGLDLGTTKPFSEGSSHTQANCNICFDEVPGSDLIALKCGHWFCRDCWSQYLQSKIDDGPSCVTTHCPYPKCQLAVDELLFQEVLPEKPLSKYRQYILRSFVEDNPYIRWCPSPHCNKAIECKDIKRLFVQCLCGHKFCFICLEEAHAPVKCEKLRLWRKKEKGESENAKWLYANTKACPACESPIQKNDGCNHMVCSKCKHDFCWVCLGPWSKHGSSWFKCNYYDPTKIQDEENEKGKVRQDLERYMFYYTRYYEHVKSKEFNESDLRKAQDKAEAIQKACGGWNAEYIVKAVEQLIENRTMLQYTYIYAFYLTGADKGKDLFEYNQAKLEAYTEEFNQLVKKILEEPDLQKVQHDPQFAREKVADQTASARDQLHQLLKGVFDEEEEALLHEPA
eukprot:CAMPEP_0174311368 /NCGR_PEP_ID=MMETSP0810-20121108/3671_1 /TAXON_ID=73025 ORGANISM="Eutreptiella gymnastica-like, Strain CCMP1594" /NCGR_SAMPLE_ID=MMETSP0810 /ASSEMBLY_ACC=CAM_ASM_000659 /LENGTH=499 /DNA_ID=CAMNT_0015419593 /DNA_START=109 /DNA_END=1605 /DNA_ORIENTATION=-